MNTRVPPLVGQAQPERSTLSVLVMTMPGLILARLLILVAVLLLWEYGTDKKTQFWTSLPSGIGKTLYGWIADGSLWVHLGATLTSMSLGYILGCAVGIAAGLLLGLMPHLGRLVAPYIAAFYALPKIALAPLFVIMLGIGIESKVALVSITVFFLVLNSTLDGIRDIDRDLIQSLLLMGATRSETTRKIVLPATLPWIFTGMRMAVRYAFTGTLLAELIASNRGLGFLIENASGSFDPTEAYAALVVLVALSVAMTEILSALERRFAKRNL